MKNWREKGRMIRSKEKASWQKNRNWLVHNSEIDPEIPLPSDGIWL